MDDFECISRGQRDFSVEHIMDVGFWFGSDIALLTLGCKAIIASTFRVVNN